MADRAREPARRRAALRLAATILPFALLGGAGFAVTEHFAAAEQQAAARARVLEEANRLRFQIEKAITGEVQLVLGLTAYVRARPQLGQAEFEAAAGYLLGQAPSSIRHIALARDLVVSHIFPLTGNEAAMGLAYRENAAQWPAVRRAVEEGRVVIAGPVALVQGGVGLIARLPIFLPQDGTADELWGIASVVVDFDAFLRATELGESRQRIELAIYGHNGGGLAGGLILGDPSLVAEEGAVVQQVALGDGSWTIVARPLEGWPRASPHRPLLLGGFLLYLLLVSLWFWRDARARLEREQATEALRLAKAEAERANRAKSQFLATMSHELRTPLNAVIGFSELLLLQLAPPAASERQRSYLQDIRTSGLHLLSMINDILDLARIEGRDLALPLAPLDARRVAGATLRLIHPQARAKGLRLRCALPRGLPPAQGNERALQQVLINLLANAVRHTEAGRRVCLRLERRGEAALALLVEDQGSGIAQERLPLLGVPFATARDAFQRPGHGAGLGLAISTALIQRMGGSLTLASRLGEGTTVTVTLPLAEAGPVPSPPPAPASARPLPS